MDSCEDFAPLLPLTPGEIADPARAQALAAHTAGCAACQARQRDYAQLQAATARTATRFTAPAELRSRLAGVLAPLPAARPAPAPVRGARGPWFAAASGWFTAGALACALAVVLALGPLPGASRLAASLAMVADPFIDNHARALVTDHLTDVLSSDRHTVKPWFRGRIDYSPPVVDLREQGFPLIGGRLEYVGHRTVAVLVYQRRQHVVDVYIWPSAGSAASGESASGYGGYARVGGSAAGMAFVAVSDLDVQELGLLSAALAAALQSPAPADARQ